MHGYFISCHGFVSCHASIISGMMNACCFFGLGLAVRLDFNQPNKAHPSKDMQSAAHPSTQAGLVWNHFEHQAFWSQTVFQPVQIFSRQYYGQYLAVFGRFHLDTDCAHLQCLLSAVLEHKSQARPFGAGQHYPYATWLLIVYIVNPKTRILRRPLKVHILKKWKVMFGTMSARNPSVATGSSGSKTVAHVAL